MLLDLVLLMCFCCVVKRVLPVFCCLSVLSCLLVVVFAVRLLATLMRFVWFVSF